jgi:hypothetical protein
LLSLSEITWEDLVFTYIIRTALYVDIVIVRDNLVLAYDWDSLYLVSCQRKLGTVT